MLTLLWLALAVGAVLLATTVFDAIAHAVIRVVTPSKDAAYTAAHFVSPAVPGRIFLSLVLLFPSLVIVAGFSGEIPVIEPASHNVSADGEKAHPGKILMAVAALLLVTAVGKTATMESMIAGEGHVAGLFRLMGGMNRAVAAKSCFDEKAYVMRMSEALLADRPAFGSFARSWYWAYFADERVTRDSRHGATALAVLEPLYRDGRLTDPAAFEMAKLFSENGMAQKARDVIESLLTRNPRNVEYAEFKAALAAENEK